MSSEFCLYTVPENGAPFVIIKLYVRIVNNEEVTVLLNTVHITLRII